MLVYPTGTSAKDYSTASIPNYSDSTLYKTAVTPREVGSFLRRTKQCVNANRFIVLDNNRPKNRDFLYRYGLYTRHAQKQVLLSLEIQDFCHVRLSSDGRELYVFCCEKSLYESAVGPKTIWIYIKHDCREDKAPYDTIISMHELELPIEMPFRD